MKILLKTYEAYFGRKLAQKNKYWMPNIVCKPYVEFLRYWNLGTRKGLQFGMPMICSELSNQLNDFLLCSECKRYQPVLKTYLGSS